MIIPMQALAEETLIAILEEFITREGTDYGFVELELEQKVASLRRQVAAETVLIVFDEQSESLTLVERQNYQPEA